MPIAQKQTALSVGALVALAGIVFVLSFALHHYGGRDERRRMPPADLPKLTFAMPVFPPEDEPSHLQAEVKQPSFHDFWFENRNANTEVTVGLLSKSCHCSQAELFLVPQDLAPPLLAHAAGRLAAAAPAGTVGDPPQALTSLARLAGPAIVQEVMTNGVLGEKLAALPLTTEDSHSVPAGAIGWIRLHWTVDTPGDHRIGIQLWMEDREMEEPALLQARVRVVSPLWAPPEIDVGPVDIGSLPRTLTVPFGSPTRSSLAVDVRLLREGQSAKADPFVLVGEPVRLSEAECRDLEGPFPGTHLRCGYRIGVQLLAVSGDGTTPLEWGRFRRYLKLDAGEGAEHLVALEGLVRGEVQVGDPKEEGVVALPPFPSGKGAEHVVVLQSDVPGMDLAVDTGRTAEFLEARLDKAEKAPSGRRTWRLTVKVLPNKVYGKFPRTDDPLLRDSAVYLRRMGGTPRSIRIPVSGTATGG